MIHRHRAHFEWADLGGLAERVEFENVGQIGVGELDVVGRVGLGQPRRRVVRRVHRQLARRHVVRRRRVVAAQHGQRGDVGAVVRVQVGEQQRAQFERVAPRLQLGERAVAELHTQQETVRFQQVARRGRTRPRNAS
jgi:hypothetical protein